MGITYFKRYRMEIGLAGRDYARVEWPEEYRLVPWHRDYVKTHAEIKYQSFRYEIDANVFPCFHDRKGCLRLMDEISRKKGFLPDATWLLMYTGAGPKKLEYCGTVQGLRDTSSYGAVQNLGITPFHRGRGLGTKLMHQALAGFQQAGLRKAYLEVTAQNEAAVEMYVRMGFKRMKTLYKAVELACA